MFSSAIHAILLPKNSTKICESPGFQGWEVHRRGPKNGRRGTRRCESFVTRFRATAKRS